MKVSNDSINKTSAKIGSHEEQARPIQEPKETSSAILQQVTGTASRQIAQHGLSVMNLQANVIRTDVQKQFEDNMPARTGKLDQAAADRFVQGNQLADELTQKKPFDLVQNGTQTGNISVRPGLNQNELLPGLDNQSKNDQNLKSVFQDAMSGKSPLQQVASTLIDGATTPSHNLGEGNILSGADTPGFKDPTDLSNYPNSKLGTGHDAGKPILGGPGWVVAKKGDTYTVIGDDKKPLRGNEGDNVYGASVKGSDGNTWVFVVDNNSKDKPFSVFVSQNLKPEQIIEKWEVLRGKNKDAKNLDIEANIQSINEEEIRPAEDLSNAPSNDTKKRPADDAPERSNAGPAPSTTPYNNLVDNEFTTFDSAGLDKYLRLAKGIQNTKVNPDPEGSEGSEGGPAPNEPVPGSGVVDPPDRPVRQTKGPIPVTGPIRRTPGGIPR